MYGISDGIGSELELLNDSEWHEGQSECLRIAFLRQLKEETIQL